MKKLALFWNTIKYLRSEQIIYRITRKMKLPCSLGVKANVRGYHGTLALIPELDFDSEFLARFPVQDLLQDKVTILHESERICWNGAWSFEARSPLWNYNLHYCEYLLSLVYTWRRDGQKLCLQKIQEIIDGWIEQNPRRNGGCGWDAYTISLRLVIWLNCYGYLEKDLDENFKQRMLRSMGEQYTHLSQNLEKHLLGNHYFENLKTLVILGTFFRDADLTEAALMELKKQCAEQILADGMHFELSPMYHKIILEDLFRVCVALQQAGKRDAELEEYLQPMVDVAFSLEEGLERIPLFNDCGNNIAKSLAALVLVAKERFDIEPQFRSCLPDSGYYIFKNGDWKLVVDAGQPGPDYLPGHAHCDAMSFELFHKGRPMLVNCGTYAYQCAERDFYRSTAAHNTVMCEGVEQSQYWGNFRMAKRAAVTVQSLDAVGMTMEMRDQERTLVTREIKLANGRLSIRDASSGKHLVSHIHFVNSEAADRCLKMCSEKNAIVKHCVYAPAFGSKRDISLFVQKGHHEIACDIPLDLLC